MVFCEWPVAYHFLSLLITLIFSWCITITLCTSRDTASVQTGPIADCHCRLPELLRTVNIGVFRSFWYRLARPQSAASSSLVPPPVTRRPPRPGGLTVCRYITGADDAAPTYLNKGPPRQARSAPSAPWSRYGAVVCGTCTAVVTSCADRHTSKRLWVESWVDSE